MFDKKTHTVLHYLESQCPSGNYKVLYKQDVLDAIPSKFGVDLATLDEIIDNLAQREYLVSKYQDDEQMCIALTPKVHSALLKNAEGNEKPKFDRKIYFIVGAIAFVGALLGVICGKLLGF